MMSYAEKPDDITKEEWMEKLNNVHIQRADMNRLIMNYLVTGETCQALVMTVTYLLRCTPQKMLISPLLWVFCVRGIQRSSREVSDGVWD